MLSPEEAKARLATLADPQWRSAVGKRIDELPSRLRKMAAPLVMSEQAATDMRIRHEESERQLTAARELDKISGPQRAEIMGALHPGLGAALARWWTDAQGRPYQRGWDRKAFRAPTAPSLTVEARARALAQLITVLGPFDADPVWLAIWAAHLDMSGPRFGVDLTAIGGVLASAIDLGGRVADETLATLCEVGNGEHPAGLMGRHVIVALLGSSRPEGWDWVERLLLAAQLQEGLRQSILEAADEGHPGAFARILDVVLEKKLLRFAATARAVGVWLGFGGSVADIPLIEARARKLQVVLTSEDERAAALAGDDPWDAYIALSAGGMRDVLATIPEAQKLAQSPSPDLRAVAVAYAAAVGLQPMQPLLAAAIDDPDIRVAALAAYWIGRHGLALPGTFDAVARLISRVPAKARDEAGFGVQQAPVTIGQAEIGGILIRALGDRPVTALLPWLPVMDATGRGAVATLITGETYWGENRPRPPQLTPETRPVLIGMLRDRSTRVRAVALKGLAKSRLDPSEAPAIEALLISAATDLRRGALTLLKSLPADEARASAARLAAGEDKRQREAAAELLREIGGGPAAGVRAGIAALQAAARRAGRGATANADSDSSAASGAAVRGPVAQVPAPIEDLHRALVASTPRTPPRHLKLRKPDKEAARILTELDEIAAAHRDVPVRITWWQGTEEMLLGDVKEHQFPSPFGGPRRMPRNNGGEEADAPRAMVLGEVFRGWWAQRPGTLRSGDDGLDALRAHILALPRSADLRVPGYFRPVMPAGAAEWDKTERQLVGDPPKAIRHAAVLRHVTGWLLAEQGNARVIEECLDALEATLARVPHDVLTTPPVDTQGTYYLNRNHLPAGDWRHQVRAHPWYRLLLGILHARPETFTPAQVGRWYRLMRWVECPHAKAQRLMVDEQILALAHKVGAASDDDAAVAFLFPHSALFKNLTRHWRAQFEDRHPELIPVADQVRDRLVAVELERGDLPTPTSATARNLSSVHGATTVARLLARLGDAQLSRGWDRGSDSRDDVLSHLIRVGFPAPGETGRDLKAAAGKAGVPDARLVDLALYAPQWAAHVESALGWAGLAEGVFWLHAHTKDRQWSVDQELRDSWSAQTAERTPLSAADLVEGAVDVTWFRRAYEALGDKRWGVLYKAARHASGGTGHRRAQMFAEAMLGQVAEDMLVARITGKRNQDAVRALGLLPLPADEVSRRAATQRRYAVLREFERGSRAFGAQRRASEGTAVRIGVENLARTAGYPDPLRFTWAAEAQEAGDLADGPVTVTADNVTLTLSVDDEGTPGLEIQKAGKVLKSVPAALRKHPDITAVQQRKTALVQQASRVRASLEAAMVAQDAFTPDDFAELRRHPVVAPMLAQLVWVAEGGATQRLGAAPAARPLRIAHPADFVAEGSWVSWQERLFAVGRRQPFKQVFRELYARTAQERSDSPVSRRYTGHQVQPRQALALLSARGWVAAHETGDAARAFHRHGLVARVTFTDSFLTAAEADLPTIDGVYFTRRGEWLAQPLDSVSDVVFSEAMRDIDLMVSVAHAGGVDPEATASTTEMRAALIRETARLLKLTNIEFAGNSHLIIKGRLGEYSLHLGSGTVHRRPGGALCIIPVGSQHRGRLFLPFADDDPKTAEVVSKALLLARDHEIKDPTILEQLRS
jgi:hypothetical protein